MGESLTLITTGLAKGLQDGVFGIFKIYNLDKEQVVRPSRPTTIREPRSTLARRRFEQMKEEEKSKPVASKSEPRVINRLIRCCTWNGGIFWLSIILFNNLLMPFLQYFTELVFLISDHRETNQEVITFLAFHIMTKTKMNPSAEGSANQNVIWYTVGPIVSWTFSALWVLPLFLLSKVVNGLWFQDIADAAYRRSRGRPILIHSISMMIADVLFSLLLQGLFLIQGTLALFLPIRGIGDLVSILHFSLLYAVYAFEYKWFNMGWEVHKRLSYVETNWPYFVGFGFPLALLTALQSSYVMSGCVFSILFPLFIISANEAESIASLQCPYPLRIFSPVIKITNFICTKLIRKGEGPRPSVAQQNPESARMGSPSYSMSPSPSKGPSSRMGAQDSPAKGHNLRSRDYR